MTSGGSEERNHCSTLCHKSGRRVEDAPVKTQSPGRNWVGGPGNGLCSEQELENLNHYCEQMQRSWRIFLGGSVAAGLKTMRVDVRRQQKS